jgi:hypothetical protein
MTYQEPPSNMYVKNMKRRGCIFTSTLLKDAMETTFTDMGVPPGLVTVEAQEIPHDRPDKDPQTLFIRYPSLFDTHLYLLDQVKMEFGVRSFREPFAQAKVQSMLSEVFPNPAYEETPFEVTVVEPRKTLLEKMFLLHEKFHTDRNAPIQLERQSRHPYDIVSLLATPAATQVLEDQAFYDRLLSHRKHYVRLAGIDYETLTPRQLRFVPYIETVETFRTDYEAMQQSMIYGESPTFEEILRKLKYFNGQVRLMGTGLSLETIIETFMRDHQLSMGADADRRIYKQDLIMIDPAGESMTLQLTFHRLSDGWSFEELRW